MDIAQIMHNPQLFHYFDGVACVWWAVWLGLALRSRRFNFGRSLIFERAARPTAYWALVAVFAGVILWTGLAATFGWGPGNAFAH
jgi:hypothetical protein